MQAKIGTADKQRKTQKPIGSGIAESLKRDWQLWLFILPLLIWLALYAYKPLWGMVIAFQKYSNFKGIAGSEFVGLKNFYDLLFGNSKDFFWRAFRNTVVISTYGIIFGFPFPIFLAVLFHELKSNGVRKAAQTFTYAPHFISEVIVCSLVFTMLAMDSGFFNVMIQSISNFFGLNIPQLHFMGDPKYFRAIYTISGIWKEAGFASIVFFASLCGIPNELYEAARVDGASRLRQVWNISLPGIANTIVVMLIIRIGNILNVGYEKVLLLYNTSTYETADILGSYIYRMGVTGNNPNYGVSTAASFINSILGFAMVIAANQIAKKYSETSLW